MKKTRKTKWPVSAEKIATMADCGENVRVLLRTRDGWSNLSRE